MKKQTMTIVAAVSFLIALFAVPAFAQIQDPVTAKIPFEFSVNNKALPAGKYTVGKLMSSRLVVVRGADRKIAAASLATATTNDSNTATTLIFHHYGNQYFLARIQVEGNNGIDLTKTKTERQAAKQANERNLAKNDSQPEIVTVPASL